MFHARHALSFFGLVLLLLSGCAMPQVRLQAPAPDASLSKRKAAYHAYHIAHRHEGKRPYIVLGNKTKLYDVRPLADLVPPQSKSARALEQYQRLATRALIVTSIGCLSGLAGAGVFFYGIVGPIQPEQRLSYFLSGIIGGVLGGALFGTWGMISAFQANHARRRALEHYNRDLHFGLGLPKPKTRLPYSSR